MPPQCPQKREGLLGEKRFKLRGKASFSIIVCVQIEEESPPPAILQVPVEGKPAFSMLLGVLLDKEPQFSLIF